ncbi:hypothetical protein Tco_1065328, partial [Tanacetum coccineum]
MKATMAWRCRACDGFSFGWGVTVLKIYKENLGNCIRLITTLAKGEELKHSILKFFPKTIDEEAILKSFRDINELIKDTPKTKSKYVSAETKLSEMHERYSQLSLQFADVQGERQKFMMTLKNVRSPRKLAHMKCSSSGTVSLKIGIRHLWYKANKALLGRSELGIEAEGELGFIVGGELSKLKEGELVPDIQVNFTISPFLVYLPFKLKLRFT